MQHRGISPRVSRNIDDLRRIRQRQLVFARQSMLAVEGTRQRFERGIPSMLICKLWRNDDAAVAHVFEKLLARLGGTAIQVLIGDPTSIECPPKVRCLLDKIHRLAT